jgi:hypothetical protein
MSNRQIPLTRNTAAVLLVDHQVGLLLGSRNPDPLVLRKNTVGLARAAQLLGVPLVVTTTMADGMFGPLFQELADLVPTDQVINRTTVNAWHEPRVVEAIERTMALTADRGRDQYGGLHLSPGGVGESGRLRSVCGARRIRRV